MTEAEKRARESISICIAHGIGVKDFFGETRLTEEECANVAENYPVSFADIKSVFGHRTGERP